VARSPQEDGAGEGGVKPRAALAALVAVAGLALASGCGDQSGSPIGFGDTTPRAGTFLAIDVQPADPFDPLVPGDTYDSSNVFVTAIVLDNSAADAFRLYLNPNNEGSRAVTDYVAPTFNAFSTGYKVYSLVANQFDPRSNNLFVAHGARGGLENNAAAVSEAAYTPGGDGQFLTRRVPITLQSPIALAEVDTVPQLTWTAVTGATRYLVQISNLNGLQYMVVVPSNSHKVQSQPAEFIQNVPLPANFFFQWNVFAIDKDNRVIGYTPAPEGFITRRPPAP
jgi:hypothetical protein